jgi:hypothetical protein
MHSRESDHEDASVEKLRQRIAREAARLVGEGQDARGARLRAARRVARRFVAEADLPAHDAILRETARVDRRGTVDGAVGTSSPGDRFERLGEMVRVLAHVRQDPVKHPEGDALEHTLQVFDLVERERPYDEELLTAALVHDVGRSVDRRDPVTAGLEAIDGLVTERTRWFVEHLPAARQLWEGTLGARARKRLEVSEDFEDLLVLEEADRKGRVRGYDSPSLETCLASLRRLASE